MSILTTIRRLFSRPPVTEDDVVARGEAQRLRDEDGRGGAPLGDAAVVVVPHHRGYGCVLRQLGKDRGGADITGVQDQVGLAQGGGHGRRARPPAARRMSVRQDHDPHGTILPG